MYCLSLLSVVLVKSTTSLSIHKLEPSGLEALIPAINYLRGSEIEIMSPMVPSSWLKNASFYLASRKPKNRSKFQPDGPPDIPNDFDGHMYDYKETSWDKSLLETLFNSTRGPYTESNYYYYPVAQNAYKSMTEYNIGYLSAFFATLCEITANKTDKHIAQKLVSGVYGEVYEFVNELRPIIGQVSSTALVEYTKTLSDMPSEQIDVLADKLLRMLRNHSLFEPDVKLIVEELDSWYNDSEGGRLMKMLVIFEHYPSKHYDAGQIQNSELRDNILAIKAIIETTQPFLAPYHRLIKTDPDRVTRVMDLIEKAVLKRNIVKGRQVV